MKRLAAVAGVGIAMCVGAGVASADYQQAGPTLTINPTTVVAGGSVTATVRSDCVDGSSVFFQIEPNGDSTPGICSNNSFVGRLTAPPRPATYDVIASGPGLDLEVKLTVTALGGSEEPLPSTGSDDAVPVALIGGVLVVGGGALVGLGRIRHRRVD